MTTPVDAPVVEPQGPSQSALIPAQLLTATASAGASTSVRTTASTSVRRIAITSPFITHRAARRIRRRGSSGKLQPHRFQKPECPIAQS